MPYKITIVEARKIRAAWRVLLPTIVEGNLPAKEFQEKAKEFRIEQGAKYGISQRTVQELLLGRSHKEPNL